MMNGAVPNDDNDELLAPDLEKVNWKRRLVRLSALDA